MSQIQFKEEETGFINHVFTNQNEASVVPNSATYTLYDKKTKAIINSREDVAIPGLAANVDLELEPDDNVIIDDTLDVEQHVLFVEWVYDTDKQGKEELTFDVINLEKVT
jgi:hypothetical protein